MNPVHPHARGADPSNLQTRLLLLRFIPTHVGRIPAALQCRVERLRFIPTHVGRINSARRRR